MDFRIFNDEILPEQFGREEILEKLKKTNFTKQLSKTFDDFSSDIQEVLGELVTQYPLLKELPGNKLLQVVKFLPDIKYLKCFHVGCCNPRAIDTNRKVIRISCLEHIKEADVKEISKEIRKAKLIKTNLKKYGVENISQAQMIKDKKIETTRRNYGVDNPLQNKLVQDKSKKTMLKKYGVTNARQSKEIVQQVKDNSVQQHGYSHYMKNPELKKIHYEKLLAKYGSPFAKQTHLKNLKDLNKSFIEIVQDIKNMFILNNMEIPEIITNSRKIIPPLELDIYIPEYNFAIEYNGSYWHSVGISDNSETFLKNKNRHYKKVNLCEQKNINLFHIYEYDYTDIKKDIILSMIQHRLKLDKRIFARKCVVKDLSSSKDIKLVNDFISVNHIQGNAGSTIKLGLFHNQELVSVMTFGKNRYNTNAEYELIRFCSLKGYTIVGGASKLFKYFITSYSDSVVSYSNRNFSSSLDNVYLKLNFEKVAENNSNLKILSPALTKFNRQSFTKKNTIKKFINFGLEYDYSKSVNINLLRNDFRLLYEAGTITYKFKGKNNV